MVATCHCFFSRLLTMQVLHVLYNTSSTTVPSSDCRLGSKLGSDVENHVATLKEGPVEIRNWDVIAPLNPMPQQKKLENE